MTRAHAETYVRAELGKFLDDPILARRFVDHGCIGDVHFGNQREIDAYVRARPTSGLIELGRCLSRARENAVGRWLTPDASVYFQDVDPRLIEVREVDRYLDPIFREMGHNLARIAADERVHRHPDFAERPVGQPVRFDVCLATVGTDGVPRLLDGMHRAIQLVMNGAQSISLCCIAEPPAAAGRAPNVR